MSMLIDLIKVVWGISEKVCDAKCDPSDLAEKIKNNRRPLSVLLLAALSAYTVYSIISLYQERSSMKNRWRREWKRLQKAMEMILNKVEKF